MRLVRLGFMVGAAVLSVQATLQPLDLAGVQTPSTAPATPPSLGQAQGRQGGNPPGAPRPRREVLLIERGRIVAALPAKAVATPRRPRKLLIFDGSANHPSVPYADLAMQLMGEKTGAFTATISGDPSVLQAESLKQYDAVYLNNNVGTTVDVFGTPELRRGLLDYVSNGGGLVASHGASVASPNWKEFGELLGASGASHRESDEKAIVHIEDPSHPITRAFNGQPFELLDEFYRFQAPFSRERLRVLMTVDAASVNEQQGRCYGRCFRDDNDYAITWIRQEGKGRVFYTALGHNPDLFWDPRMLEMFLAGTQYALGDLDADATPKPRETRRVDQATGSAGFEWRNRFLARRINGWTTPHRDGSKTRKEARGQL
jgi:type 1 glutamine amidotransferase